VQLFYPLAFEDGVYTVRIYRDGTLPYDRNTYSTMVTAKSPRDAYKKVINTPEFKRWKDDVEKRIKEGKERTDYSQEILKPARLIITDLDEMNYMGVNKKVVKNE
jgi:hypothetical protein